MLGDWDKAVGGRYAHPPKAYDMGKGEQLIIWLYYKVLNVTKGEKQDVILNF